MTVLAQPLAPESRASDGLIASPDALINHLARVVDALDQSAASTHLAIFGPFRVQVKLHGRSDAAAIFSALPSPQSEALPAVAGNGRRQVDFTINVIDATCCCVARPRLTWQTSDFGLKLLVPGWSNMERTTYFLHSEDGVAIADWRTRKAYVWIPSLEAMPTYERSVPFRWMLEGLAERNGLTTMHAAGIGVDGIGVLIVGEGGRGKSTLALAAVDAGMDVIGDDYCLIDAQPPFPAYRLFNAVKVRADSEGALQWISRIKSEVELDRDKLVLNLARHAPERTVHQLEIRALLLTEFTDGPRAVIERVSAKAAFCRAAPSTIAQYQVSDQRTVADIRRLAQMLPSYRIRMPREPRRSVDQIKELVRTLRARMEAPSS